MTDILFSRYARSIAAIACPLLLIAAGSSSAIGRMGDAGQSTDPQTEAAVAVLAGQVTGEVQRLPATSSIETFEATILFVVDQAAQPVNVVCSALDRAAAEPGTPNNAKAAMGNVCRVAQRRSGTGAIGGNGAGVGSTAFGIPSISLGGGGSNYSSSNRR